MESYRRPDIKAIHCQGHRSVCEPFVTGVTSLLHPPLDNYKRHLVWKIIAHPTLWSFFPTCIWLCMKIPLSAKRVAWGVWFGGMFRGMFRRYDSGYDSPHLLYCLHKDYILYQRALSYTKLATGPTGPWHSKARFGYDSGYVSGMIRGMTRAGDCFCKNKVEGQSFVKYKTKKMHILCTRSFWWHCLTALAPSIPRKTWPTGK